MARKLQLTDVFEGGRLILKIGIREEVEEVAKRAEESKEKRVQIDMGFDLFFGILSKAIEADAEKEVYKFLANIFECTPEEISKMDPLVVFNELKEVASFEEWANFIKGAIKLIRKKR